MTVLRPFPVREDGMREEAGARCFASSPRRKKERHIRGLSTATDAGMAFLLFFQYLLIGFRCFPQLLPDSSV